MESISNENKKNYEENSSSKLIRWASNCKSLLVDEQDTPITNFSLCDIKIKRRDEDEVFLSDDEVFNRIRRGNCILEYKEKGLDKFKVGRKGLKKFFDYKIRYKNKGDDRKIKNRVLDRVKAAFKEEKLVVIYFTTKENGENVQIAYEEISQGWIIASKNVSMLCRNREDIQWYVYKSQNKEKYSFSIEFAEVWFDILEKKIIENNNLEEFINSVKGYTLVGENINYEIHQHIKLYDKNDIIFYAMIKNEGDELCMPLLQSQKILTKFGLSYVEVTTSPYLKDYDEFISYMNKKYIEVLENNVESSGEGSVAYFSSLTLETNEEEVVSMAKLKTFEYRFLRKLREKLKSKNFNPDNIYTKIKSECEEILGEEGDEVDLDKYMKFAKFILNFVADNRNKSFMNSYASFIQDMKKMYNYQDCKLDDNDKVDANIDKLDIQLNSDNEDKKIKKNNKKQKNKKKFKNKSEDIIELENDDDNNNSDKFEKGKIYFLLNFGLVAGGKSTLYHYLKDFIDTTYKNEINLMHISSDEFALSLIQQYMKNNPKSNFNYAFEKTKGQYKNQFNKELKRIVRYEKDSNKINIMFIDKNFNKESVRKLYKIINEENYNFEFIILHPDTKYPIHEGSLEYPFSWSYFIQTYHRLRLRKDHETLDYNKNPNAHYILLSFLQLYKGVKEFNSIHINDNIKLHTISFADEKELEIPDDIKKLFRQIMSGIGKNQFDIEAISQYDDQIKNLFKFIEENYPSEYFEDTREKMKTQIEEFIIQKMNK